MGLMACSQKNSIDSGSEETPSTEVPSEAVPGAEASNAEIPGDKDGRIENSIGRDEAIKYYDYLQLTNGNFAHIDFDAATGELLVAEEQIEYSNGEVEWKSFDS